MEKTVRNTWCNCVKERMKFWPVPEDDQDKDD